MLVYQRVHIDLWIHLLKTIRQSPDHPIVNMANQNHCRRQSTSKNARCGTSLVICICCGTYTCLFVYIYIYIYVCVCMCICIYIYILYIYIPYGVNLPDGSGFIPLTHLLSSLYHWLQVG